MKKILLHCCCAPCATWCIEKLKSEGNDIVLFYDNPNIAPEDEREKRLDNLKFLAAYHKLPLLAEHTPHALWLEHIRGLEAEKEHGARCVKCFEFNLSLANKAMEQNGCDAFTTSLTVSRFKNSSVIFSVAEQFGSFAFYNFKKEGGFEKSNRMSQELGLYRQRYCGCEFSCRSDDAK